MNKIEVKLANRSDMRALAKIQVDSWSVAFKDILSKKTLEKYQDVEEFTNFFESVFDSKKGTFYIAYLDEKPCGEVFWCDSDEEDNLDCVEVVAFHSLKETWGKGVGKAMMDRTLQDILKSGKYKAYLWVFKDNYRARKFYEKCGFKSDGVERISDLDGALEVRYWRYII